MRQCSGLKGARVLAAMVTGILAAVASAAPATLHSVTFLDASAGLPRETAEQVEAAKTFDPAAPCPGIPSSAAHLVKSGVYKALDCLVQGDRFEYWDDDVNGQFLVILPKQEALGDGLRIRLTLHPLTVDGREQPAVATLTEAAQFNKASFLVAMSDLAPGAYRVKGVFVDAEGAAVGEEAEGGFTRVRKQNPVVRIPAEGIPILLEAPPHPDTAVWPVRTGIPLPVNAVMDVNRLGLFENGARIAAEIRPRATWCPKGSIKWIHLDFIARYVDGKPAEYRLKLLPNPARLPMGLDIGVKDQPVPPTQFLSPLKVDQTDDAIAVDTGAVRFIVSRRQFAGIEKAWYDPTGSGKYDEALPVIDGQGGPYLVDGRIIRFDAFQDKEATVVVEESGPVKVTLRAEGWYQNPEGRVAPICRFQTRITAYAGRPMIRVAQSTILAYDTRKYFIKDLGFAVRVVDGDAFRLGADGAVHEGNLGRQNVWLHQDRYDHFRLFGAKENVARGESPFIEGERSDGWFSLSAGKTGAEVTLFLRDIWQKFPKEATLGQDGMTLHFWPAHGHRAFPLEEELKIGNIYKFWCFHQGALLNLTIPVDYFEKFDNDYASGSFECRPEHALNGNARGAVIGNEFAILFSPAARGPDGADELLALSGEDLQHAAQRFQYDPVARAPAEWNAQSGAMGRVGAVDREHFEEMEDAVEKGFLSHNRCVERGKEWGMWNYADTHTYWNVENDHAQLHRVWHNSHYHEMGISWIMYYRSGSPDLLRWARASTDHWMNVDTVNWDDPDDRMKFHMPGAMYHCKGLTHWGAEAYGMVRRDGHAGLGGHWADSDAFLWCWYITGNPRARDVYAMWANSYTRRPWYAGTRREANTTFAMVMEYYLASWDPNMLPAIRGQALSLRTHEPLEKQNPGPLWHPLWITRYYEHTRDPDYVPFILKYGRGIQLADTWTTALSALAYHISGDKTYLTQHFEQVATFPCNFYHAPGDLYDWYGMGCGPLGSRWGGYFCWGHFAHALKQAGITKIAPTGNTRFSYLVGGNPSLTVYAVEKKDRPFTLTFRAQSLGGDLHRCHVQLFSPAGKAIEDFTMPPHGGPSAWTEVKKIGADKEIGVYRFELSVHEAKVYAPLTNLDVEAAVLPKGMALRTSGMYGLLRPTQDAPITWTIDSGMVGKTTGRACNVLIYDAAGKLLLDESLFRPRGDTTAAVTLDPKKHPLPWVIDIVGPTTIQWEGDSEQMLLAPTDDALKAVLELLKK